MNPNLCRVSLRPRGPLEVFDLAVRLLRTRSAPFGRMAALVLLPTWVVASVAAWLTDGHWGVLVVTWLAGIALRAPFTVLAGRLLFADDVSVLRVLLDLIGQAPSLLALWSLRTLAWGVAALTCFVGLIPIQAALVYLDETLLLERVAPARALRRTSLLAGRQAANFVFGVGAGWALDAWMAALGESVGQSLIGFVLQLGEPFGSALTLQVTPYALGGLLLGAPLFAVYRLLLYVDVRTRVEGWDLQVGLRAAGLDA